MKYLPILFYSVFLINSCTTNEKSILKEENIKHQIKSDALGENELYQYSYSLDLNKDKIEDKIYCKDDSMFIFISKDSNNFKLSYSGLNFIYEREKFIDTIFIHPKRKNSMIMTMYSQSGQAKDTLIISHDVKNNWILDSLITYTKERNDPEFKAYRCLYKIEKRMNDISIDQYLEYYNNTTYCKEISLIPYSKNINWKW